MAREVKVYGEKRLHHLFVCVNDEELAIIDKKRDRQKYSTFFRRLALGQKMPASIPAINAQAIRELNKIGSNLNQLVHAAHRAGRREDLEKIMGKVFAETYMLASLIDQIETGRMDASSDSAQA